MLNKYYDYIEVLKKQGRHRELLGRTSKFSLSKNYTVQQESVNLDFTSNDYLALSNHEQLIEAAYVTAINEGVGATGSRLLSGDREIFLNLEQRIAKDKGTEAALIFNTGFQANISVLSSLLDWRVLGAKPIVFFDKLNHASMYQAIFLSTVELIRYRHNDLQHLSDLLAKYMHIKRPKFIVTETLFGMDGDLLLIKELIKIATKHQAFIYLDEAHATGVVGVDGYGLAAKLNFEENNYLLMGTFSKALGCSGGYIAGKQIIIDYLINKSPGFIYSTAISPMVIGAVSKSWNLIKGMQQQRALLLQHANYLRNNLQELGFNTGLSSTHIIPIILGTEQLTLEYKEKLLRQGIMLSAIRPPTVPVGTSRLRIALNARHNQRSLAVLLEALEHICVNV